MTRRMLSLALAGILALATFAACQSNAPTLPPTAAPAEAITAASPAAATAEASPTAAPASSPAPTNTVAATATPTESGSAQATAASPTGTASAAVQITLTGDAIAADGPGVAVQGASATITAAGAYRLSGALSDGQIVVDVPGQGQVQLILDGLELTNASGAPLVIANAGAVEILLADGAVNALTDGASYLFANPEEDEPDAALFSNADLTIAGNGALTVTGNYDDGIASERGRLVIAGGVITVTAKGDALTAETDLLISDGQLTLTAGGGSGSFLGDDASAKGIKADVSIAISGGVITVDAADDALNSDDSLTIDGGQLTLASGDDAIHAENTLIINDGVIRITQSVEGIESVLITINGGDIDLVSSDDGINAAGNDSGGNQLFIHGGNIAVNAAGDGIDVNGSIEMTDGVVIINGPTENMNGALDYDATFDISGGFLAAAGSIGMAQAPSRSSGQPSLMLNFPAMLPAGTMIHIQTSSGDSLLTFAPLKAFQSLVFSSPALAMGDAIEVYYGGSASEALGHGLYQGSYTPGEQVASFTISEVVTVVGNRRR